MKYIKCSDRSKRFFDQKNKFELFFSFSLFDLDVGANHMKWILTISEYYWKLTWRQCLSFLRSMGFHAVLFLKFV